MKVVAGSHEAGIKKKGFKISENISGKENQGPIKVAIVFHCPDDFNSKGEHVFIPKANPFIIWEIKSGRKLNNKMRVTSIYYGNPRYIAFSNDTESEKNEREQRLQKTVEFSKENDLVLHVVYAGQYGNQPALDKHNGDKGVTTQYRSVKNAIKESASNKAGHMVVRCCTVSNNPRRYIEVNPEAQNLLDFFSSIPEIVIDLDRDISFTQGRKNIIGGLSDTAEQTIALRKKAHTTLDTLASNMATAICSEAIEKSYTAKYPNKPFDIKKYKGHTEKGELYDSVKSYCLKALSSNPDTMLSIQEVVVKEAKKTGKWEKFPPHEDIAHQLKVGVFIKKMEKIEEKETLSESIHKVLNCDIKKEPLSFDTFSLSQKIARKFFKSSFFDKYDPDPFVEFLNQLKNEMGDRYPLEQGLPFLNDNKILENGNIRVEKEFIEKVSDFYQELISVDGMEELKIERKSSEPSLDTRLFTYPIFDSNINQCQTTFLMVVNRMKKNYLESLPQNKRLNKAIPKPAINKIGNEAFGQMGWSDKIEASKKKQNENQK